MGSLEKRKRRAIFETTNTVWERRRERRLIVELKPEFMIFRIKGTRRPAEILSYTSAFNLAIRNRHFTERMAKAKKRGNR